MLQAKRLGQWGGGWNSFGPAPMLPGRAPYPTQEMNSNPYSWNRSSSFGGGSSFQAPQSAPIAAGPQCYTCSNQTTGETRFDQTPQQRAALASEKDANGIPLWNCRKDNCSRPPQNFGSFGAAFGGGQASSVSSMEINSPYAPFGTATGLSGRKLGQSPGDLPLQFSYADAVAWLAAADGMIRISPICELPIVGRFRSFVASTPPSKQGTAVWTFSAEDSQGMADFVACTEEVKPHVADYDWKISDHAPELIGAGIAAGLLAWALLY